MEVTKMKAIIEQQLKNINEQRSEMIQHANSLEKRLDITKQIGTCIEGHNWQVHEIETRSDLTHVHWIVLLCEECPCYVRMNQVTPCDVMINTDGIKQKLTDWFGETPSPEDLTARQAGEEE
tara:strand:- start:688 stop:1053 length:366 start_codon:yes stop_codon:yes gene_type:complete